MKRRGLVSTRHGRLLALAGLFAGLGTGLAARRTGYAGHVDAPAATESLHLGVLNDNDVGSSEFDSGIITTTRLTAFATPALELRSVGSVSQPVLKLIAASPGQDEVNGGEAIGAFGGSHTGSGSSPTNDGGTAIVATGGFTLGSSSLAFGGDGVFGTGGSAASAARSGAGVRGGQAADALPGVVGQNTSSVHPAVAGINQGSNFGVFGSSGGVGIRGVSFGSNAAGVQGVASGSGPGVWGFTSSGHAVLGNSATGNGGVFVGLTGLTSTGSPNAVVANGNVFSTGTGHFNGGIVVGSRVADGGLRATYGVTSPDAVVEDFGRARLVGGQARVELDPGFAALIATGDYHVFATPGASCGVLYATNKSASGFDVRESDGRGSTVEFDYRVVAKRGGPTSAARFARVVEPEPVYTPVMKDVPRSFADVAHLVRDAKSGAVRDRQADAAPDAPSIQPTPRR